VPKTNPGIERLRRNWKNAQRSADEAELAHAALCQAYQEAALAYRTAIGKVKGPNRSVLKKNVKRLRKEALSLRTKCDKARRRVREKHDKLSDCHGALVVAENEEGEQ